MLGRSGTTLMYLAAAGAMYAWRARRRGRDAAAPTTDRGHGSFEDQREIEPAKRWRDDPPGHGAVGITDLPPHAEAAEQASLPERGTRKGGVHA
jgi:hypothetical protein